MISFKYNRFLVACILIGLIAALMITFQRNQIEKQNNTVDLAIGYSDIKMLAQEEGTSIQKVMATLKEAGITSVNVDEITFKELKNSGEAALIPGGDILRNYHDGTMSDPNWRNLVASGVIKGDECYVVANDPTIFEELKEDLPNKLGANRVKVLKVGNEEIIAVNANYKNLSEEGIGLSRRQMEEVNAAGLYVLARPSDFPNPTKEKVDSVFKRLDGIKVSEIVFAGKQALGNPSELKYTADQFMKHNYTLGLIEAVSQLQFYKQTGALEIAKVMDYKVARLYAIPKDEQPKLPMATAVERWANTDEERNIRIDLMRAYEKPLEGKTLLETNVKYISDTKQLLEKKGFKLGPATHFDAYYPLKVLQIITYLGICAAAVLYLSLVCPKLTTRRQYILLGVVFIIGAAILTFSVGGKIRVVSALVAANVFPAIAMIGILDNLRKHHLVGKLKYSAIVFKAIKAFICASIISMIGAMFLSGILSDITYFLEVNIFRGIKLTFVLPMILVAIAFLRRFDIFGENLIEPPGITAQIKRILNQKITVKAIIALFFVMFAAIIFVGRSGHTEGIPVPGIELKVRAFLEKIFYARPRSKELFIGHPAFMLMVMAWYRKWPAVLFFVLTMVGTIGQGSMVETFAHMRTPVFMSFMRGFDGALWGCILGIVIMTILYFWQYWTSKEDRSKSVNE